LHVEHGAERVLELRVLGALADERLQQRLGGFVLALAHLRDGERVRDGGIARLARGGALERGLGVVEQVHLQADAAESEEDLLVLGRELLRAHPVGEGPLQLAVPLGDHGRLPQRRDRARLQRESRVVGLERPRRIALHLEGTAQGERQLVRPGVGLSAHARARRCPPRRGRP
jgi:hypothetical protein